MEIFSNFGLVERVLIYASCGLCVVQLLYYLCLYNRIRLQNRREKKNKITYANNLVPVSVVVCAYNQAENLNSLLPVLLEQDYPQYEVILIDEGSTDHTDRVLTIMEQKYPHFYHSFIPIGLRGISAKKLALTLGIKAAKYEWVLFTESYCVPQGKEWLRLMCRNFTPNTELVLGYTGYGKAEGFTAKFQAYNNLLQTIRYLGCACTGAPYCGSGRNMAYRKSLFFKHKGFSRYLFLERGEDDLFVNAVACKANTRVETNPGSIMLIKAPTPYKVLKEDMIHYYTTSHYYKGIQRYILGGETCTRLLLYALCVISIAWGCIHQLWALSGAGLAFLLARYITQMVILNKTEEVLGEVHRYYGVLPVFDLLGPLQALFFKINYFVRKGIK